MGKYFGTDGFRGEAGVNLTADHAYKVGRFLGWYYNALRERNGNNEPARIVIGKDTRRSSYMFEYSLVAGLTASGADAYLLHVTTTPSVAYIARVDDFDCGIMISASHNPFYDNGIKLIDCYGEKMPEETLLLVEDYIDGKLHVFDQDWPKMSALTDNLLLKVVSYITDPVTTTDELIPSGETSSFRSNPLKLAEFALSRKDPAYVGKAKEVQKAEKAREEGKDPVEALAELKDVYSVLGTIDGFSKENTGIGSTIYAVKPGDGSAREQAASCQKVLGGWANIANEYATKRYRSNLINWGMVPFIIDETIPFENGDYIYVPDIRKAVAEGASQMKAYVIKNGKANEFEIKLGALTDDEKKIILDGCLINFYRS